MFYYLRPHNIIETYAAAPASVLLAKRWRARFEHGWSSAGRINGGGHARRRDADLGQRDGTRMSCDRVTTAWDGGGGPVRTWRRRRRRSRRRDSDSGARVTWSAVEGGASDLRRRDGRGLHSNGGGKTRLWPLHDASCRVKNGTVHGWKWGFARDVWPEPGLDGYPYPGDLSPGF